MSTQEANHARGGSEANPCGSFSLREGTQGRFEVPQKGKRCNPKGDGHHHRVHCRTYIGFPPFFGLNQQKPVANSARENGPQQHFVSFPQVRRGKKLMRAIDIETKSTPKPFPLAQISGHFFLSSFPYIWHHGNDGWGQSSFAAEVGLA